ncbi:gamma-glutamyltransferase 2 [Breoghania corrubedonensis]|uniref:Glutathione hydrolase proenzyme n=1 Tax=Breoghania corrubedonensis TaxID=665038 RepID=A0A2T5VHT7_9HYPH|nr:gamma-glutamyltransferase [Breoghania corrubedonensis]PTW63321.1 gamma-glutamyltransferase 2 [Breoghania corrubedonensis]
MHRNFQLPGRSPVHARTAVAATSHPLATSAALDVLRSGGNAADAAVAALAVQCVVEPHMTGIGGDCFAIVAEPDGTVRGLNGSGRAPAQATPERLSEAGLREIADDSIHAVTVPGAIKAWETLLASHGSWSMARVLAQSIDYAENGFPVAPRVGSDWARLVGLLQRDEGAIRHYLVDGEAPAVGSLHRLPALAETLRAIADQGASAFYEGPIAAEIAATVRAKGGFLSEEDLAGIDVVAVDPVASDYRGVTMLELPPNGHGVTALILLNILENFDLNGLDPDGPERFHLEMEAARLAYSIRDLHVADPDAMTVSLKDLVSKEFAARLAARIDPAARIEGLPTDILTPDSDTVYLSVVDGEGMAVSLINSLYCGFGVGVATPKSGILLQNRGACFRLQPGHPNCIGPRKRPLHTIIPAMALKADKPWLSFGVMGGAYQPCGHAHVLGNIVDYGMDVQQAIDAPRIFFDGIDGPLLVEAAIGEATRVGLRERGHRLNDVAAPLGGSQAIMIGDDGVRVAGSDPRKDGCALGW